MLLKDWTPWVSGSTYETNVFQLKVSGNTTSDSGVPLQFRTARNAMRLRYVGSTSVTDIIPDLRPYVNQWMHFRVDVLWATGATGYIKTYMKLPGESSYTLVDQKTNYETFAGDPLIGNFGYIKWGVYDAQAGLTRIAYHDDIRVYELNNTNSNKPIWSNPITSTTTPFPFTAPVTTGNVSTYGINDDESSVPPSFFYNNAGSGLTVSPQQDRVLLGGWSWKAASSDPATALNPNQYYEFKVQPKPYSTISFSDLAFTVRRGNVADPNTYVMRSSLDGFTNDISAPQTYSATANTLLSYNLSALPAVTQPITFRLYWYGSNRIASGALVGINDFVFSGKVQSTLRPSNPLPVTLGKFDASANNGIVSVNWTTFTEMDNSHFEVQASANGGEFQTVKTVKSKNGNATAKQQYETSFNGGDAAYVRLVTVDTGGSKAFSPVVRLNTSKGPTIDAKVFPNPASDVVTIASANATPQVQRITDVTGANVTSLVETTSTTGAVSLAVERLPKGMYFVELLQNATRKTVKFVKQ